MNSYFSTFITGFDEVIKEQLLKRLKDINIVLLSDGLIVYKTASPTEEIKWLKFLNNSFVLLRKFEHTSENSVNQVVRTLIRDQNLANVFRQNFSKKKFNVFLLQFPGQKQIIYERSLLVHFYLWAGQVYIY